MKIKSIVTTCGSYYIGQILTSRFGEKLAIQRITVNIWKSTEIWPGAQRVYTLWTPCGNNPDTGTVLGVLDERMIISVEEDT